MLFRPVTLVLTMTFAACLQADEKTMVADPVRVMSFNIRYANHGDGLNAWPFRRTMVAGSLRFHDIDVAGLQEALRSQIDDLAKQLPQYDWVGVGRDDGKDAGEFSPIFYRRDRFALIDSGTFWLSPTPEKVASKGWDAALPRIATWARLKEKRLGRVWYFLNTHFDHVGEKAREESAKLIFERLRTIADNQLLLVLTGDFNVRKDSASYRTLTSNPPGGDGWHLDDAHAKTESPHFGLTTTWNGFERPVPDQKIDFILFAGPLRVLQHAIPGDMADGRFASDHYAVVAEFAVANEEPASKP